MAPDAARVAPCGQTVVGERVRVSRVGEPSGREWIGGHENLTEYVEYGCEASEPGLVPEAGFHGSERGACLQSANSGGQTTANRSKTISSPSDHSLPRAADVRTQ